ncbi:MAG: DoxX family protein [Planctomycetia bacterium]|nr:DoxX family protein [Planctomycetia bacterium]
MASSEVIAPSATVPRVALWTGRILSGLLGVFLLFDGGAKLFKPEPVIEGTLRLGYSESVIVPLGIVLIACTVIYLIPRTAILGAILLTGYFGGAVASHVRVGDDGFSIGFGIGFGVLTWLALYLREPRLRALVPLRS